MSDETPSGQVIASGDASGAVPMHLILSTFPGEAIARQIAQTLVKERLVACVNLLPGVTSIYRWEGKMETSAEVMAVFKTSAAPAAVMARIKELHPYKVPELVVMEAAQVHPAYLEWVRSSCG